jgi:putative NIF3 family GTP cyclohydrolase 1 type 2
MNKIATVLLLACSVLSLSGQKSKPVTASQLTALIINKTAAPQIPNTVDVIKEGDPETNVTGIVTTMFATMDVLKEAVAKKCNLIISHEPLYYNHLDDTKRFTDDPVFREKQKFILDNKLVVWRFHDYIHSINPDGILSGMVAKLNWKNYMLNGQLNRFVLPETTLNDLLKYLKNVFPGNAFYVVGKQDMKLKNVSLAPGAPGSASHIKLLEDKNIDVVIAGESPQWETYEYMRDAVAQGRKKAIIFLGHVSSEEAGMEFCAGWLKSFIKDVPVHFVSSQPAYWSY